MQVGELSCGDILSLSLTCSVLHEAVQQLTVQHVIIEDIADIPDIHNKPVLGLKIAPKTPEHIENLQEYFKNFVKSKNENRSKFARFQAFVENPRLYKVSRLQISSAGLGNLMTLAHGIHEYMSHTLLDVFLRIKYPNVSPEIGEILYPIPRRRISCLDFEVDLLCNSSCSRVHSPLSCKETLLAMLSNQSWDNSVCLTIRIVSTTSPESTLTVGLLVQFIKPFFRMSNLHRLNLVRIPHRIRQELAEEWLAPGRQYFSKIRQFTLVQTSELASINLLMDSRELE